MASIRPQYHFRKTKTGIDAWDVKRLISLSRDLPIDLVDPDNFAELDQDHWYFDGSSSPTPRNFLEHVAFIELAEYSWPIILDSTGRVLDGMHRICKAILEQETEIPAVQFTVDPEPDFTDCDPEALPYDA
jgi:hypothetical protein